MKKSNVFMVAMMVAAMGLTGCTAGSTSGSNSTGKVGKSNMNKVAAESTTEETTKKMTQEEASKMIEDTMQAINDVKPGSAGSGIRQLKAAEMLLDLSENIGNQEEACDFDQVVTKWMDENVEDGDAFDEAYTGVRVLAEDYMTHPDDYQEQLEETGYELSYSSYTKSNLDMICGHIEALSADLKKNSSMDASAEKKADNTGKNTVDATKDTTVASATTESTESVAASTEATTEQIDECDNEEQEAKATVSDDDSWKEAFEKRLYEEYQVTVDHYEDIGDGWYNVYVEIDGEVVRYVVVNSADGYFHG